jgi:hypothetical protein
MNADLHTLTETVSTEQPTQYTFVIDAELAQVGGGTPAVDY